MDSYWPPSHFLLFFFLFKILSCHLLLSCWRVKQYWVKILTAKERAPGVWEISSSTDRFRSNYSWKYSLDSSGLFSSPPWPLSPNHQRGITHPLLNIQTEKPNILRLGRDYLVMLPLILSPRAMGFNQDAAQSHVSFCKLGMCKLLSPPSKTY